jgi:hypothetical protein
MIISIDKIEENKDLISVIALVEDAFLAYPQTYFDPPEYGPALCQTSFYLDEDENLPQDENNLIKYLNELNLDWQLLPKDWEY